MGQKNKTQTKQPKLGGASAINVVNQGGGIVRTYGPEESDDRADFVAKAEEFVQKENARHPNNPYELVPVKGKKSKKDEEDAEDVEDKEDDEA